MKRIFLLLLLLHIISAMIAQDAYHQSIRDYLEDDFNVTTGEWMFSDNEAAVLDSAVWYGGAFLTEEAVGQDFSTKISATIPNAGKNVWDAGWKIKNNIPVEEGDVIMVQFYLRSVDGPGECNFFIENDSTFVKEIFLTFDIEEEWRSYVIPFESMVEYTASTSSWGFHLANQAQTIELGGFTALNFQQTVELRDLPSHINNESYGGYEEDATWRAGAAQRIEQLRKADLDISVKNTSGELIENAQVNVKMLRHNFDFGTAVVAGRLANTPIYNQTYENKLTDLDGEGHGFNSVVFENDLKWDGWEEEWYVNKTQLQNAVSTLVDKGLEIRGHTLVWPGTSFLPEDIPLNYDDIDYMKDRIFGHLEEIMNYPGIGDEIKEWDVLNEVVINQDVANAFSESPDYETGRELYIEIFEKAREENPEAELWLNDYVTMTLGNTSGDGDYDRLKEYTQEIVNSSVDIKGVGFQAHISASPYSIYDVLGTLDDFSDSFGTKAKITEFDLPSFVNANLAADYLRDFMTAIYSHESVEGFLFWSFWDGQTYINKGCNLYRNDWTETPSHAAFVDLLFTQWWTDELASTDLSGQSTVRGYKGQYELSYQCEGETVRDTIWLKEALDYEIVCDNINTSTANSHADISIEVYPNPSLGSFKIKHSGSEVLTLQIVDLSGKNYFTTTTEDQNFELNVDLPTGIYLFEFTSKSGKVVEKVEVY